MNVTKHLDNKRIPTRTLIACLMAHNPKIRDAAMFNLTRRRHRPNNFIHTIGKLALDKKQPESIRISAIQGLGLTFDRRALPYLRQIANDVKDDICRRGDALEQMGNFRSDRLLEEFIAFLSDDSADMRFWALFCLSHFWNDATPALDKIDQIVAHDHAVPQCFGWHVDREALLPYETVYFNLAFPQTLDRDHDDYRYAPRPILISPTPEYWTFSHEYRKWTPGLIYENKPVPPITLHVDGEWLAARIQEHWPDAAFNVRFPRPVAYQFDFKIVQGEDRLIGGLHRDGYALILTGDDDLVTRFSKWYRTLIDASETLYTYEWAYEAKLLT